MSPEKIGLALLLVGPLLLVAKAVRVQSRLAQRLFLPTSIIAGFIGLLLGPDVLGALAGWFGVDRLAEGGLFGADVFAVWEELPELLISVVFAALFLGNRLPSLKQIGHMAGPQ